MQYSVNENAQYCNVWYLDKGTLPQEDARKVNTSSICYTVEVDVMNVYTGLMERKKWGCAHLLPGNVLESWAERTNWYDCQALGANREICRADAFSRNTGYEGGVFVKMLQYIKVRPDARMCAAVYHLR